VSTSLAVYFILHTLFTATAHHTGAPLQLELPVIASWSQTAFALTAVALTAVLRLRWSPLRTLGVCAVLGLATLALPSR